jgi:hypothetical protein
MAWDDEELRASVLEEFAMNLTDGDVWQEQAEAARAFERQRKGKFAVEVAAQIAAGKCRYYNCWAPPEPGMSRCALHREIHRLSRNYDPIVEREKRQLRYDPAAQAERRKELAKRKKEAGMCLDCTAPAMAGKTLCERHAASRAANTRASYKRRLER